MTKLNSYSEELKTHIDTLDEQILQTVFSASGYLTRWVRDQSEIGRSAETDVADAKQTISDLFGRIIEIKEKAAQSEEMVQVICKWELLRRITTRNISKLDAAKRNLTESLNALARLQMFLSSLDAAEALKGTHQYIKASRSMAAVMQLSRFFDKYKDIETVSLFPSSHAKIQTLLHRVEILRDAFCTTIFTDFDQIEDLIYTFDDASNRVITEDMLESLEQDDQAYDDSQVTRPRLQAACYVIDAMGVETRDRLVKSFCVNQLKNYEQLFRPESAGEGLDQVERCYHWFWRCLSEWASPPPLTRSYDAKYRCLFPFAWHVDAALLQHFCERTKEHLQTVLARFETPEMVDVPLLVNALRVTMQFERVGEAWGREA